MDERNQLLDLVNSTGFIFQIGIGEIITRSGVVHEWIVMCREHPWRRPIATGTSGFADFVLQSGKYPQYRMVIECKRATKRDWVFLAEHRKTVLGVSVLVSRRKGIKPAEAGWTDANLNNPSIQSAFCVIRGQGDGQTPMLERIADTLLPSTEAIGIEEASVDPSPRINVGLGFFPVIVTNARLSICYFKEGSVDLSSGTLPSAEFEEDVPFVRFRKSLTTYIPGQENPRNLAEANRFNERTIMVVNANHLVKFLVEFRTDLTFDSDMQN